jgi:hypothetical protein
MQAEINSAISLLNDALSKSVNNNKAAVADIQQAIDTLTPLTRKSAKAPDTPGGEV